MKTNYSNLSEGARALLKKEKINDIQFSPDGTWLALASNIGIWIYDAHTGEQLSLLAGHARNVTSVVFSPDGHILAMDGGIWDKNIYLYNVATSTLLQSFTGYEAPVHSLAFSPDGSMLASGCNDGTVLLWNVTTGALLKTFTGHTSEVNSICFFPDGSMLASECNDGTVLLWDIDSNSDQTIFIEVASELSNRESQIQRICTKRGIKTLIHFTRVENLQSILQHGLLGRSFLETHEQQFLFNDQKRLDKHKEAICLSISFPNYPMFHSTRKQKQKSEKTNNSHWVVMLLDAKVLWELDCAFCQENAASNAVRHVPLEEKKKPEVLKGMFADVYHDTKGNTYRRSSLQIPNHYPTHPQAEVLIFDPIPVKYIKEIHFYTETALVQWRYINPGNHPPKIFANQQYFKWGHDQVN